MTTFAKYFDRIAIINLPSRPDRLRSIRKEINDLGLLDSNVDVPPAPMPESADGFRSRGVYGNFLSHLNILKDAEQSGCKRVLVLEDDAIFSRDAQNPEKQEKFVTEAETHDWAMWFLGHKLRRELRGEPKGVTPNKMEFTWAHAYSVQSESLPELIAWLETTLSRPAGHPDGGRMYIDGAYYHYRATESSKVCLISNPALSIQKGSDSSLGPLKQPGRLHLQDYPKHIVRTLRDEFWRRFKIDFR